MIPKFLNSYIRKFLNSPIRIISLSIILLIGPLIYFVSRHPQKVEAGWWDDTWHYRTAITVTNSGAADSNKKIKFDIDTQTLITDGKMQTDCGDSRFTSAEGVELLYYLDSAGGDCNTASTDYYVLVPTIPTGNFDIYHYYGNPSAINGTQSAQFSQATFSPGSTSPGSEEKGTSPIAYWSFNEGVGSTAYDQIGNYDGILGAGTSAPTWTTDGAQPNPNQPAISPVKLTRSKSITMP